MAHKHNIEKQSAEDAPQETLANAPDEIAKVEADEESIEAYQASDEFAVVEQEQVGPSLSKGITGKGDGKEDYEDSDELTTSTDIESVSPIETTDNEKKSQERGTTVEKDLAQKNIDIERLISLGVAIDAEAVTKECAEIKDLLKEKEYWVEKQDKLSSLLVNMVNGFKAALKKFEQRDLALSSEIRKKLSSRAEGIYLCGRMIERAQIRANNMIEVKNNDNIDMPVLLTMDVLSETVNTLPLEEVNKAIETHLKTRRIDHNQFISGIRRQAGSAEKTFISLVERQVLPVVDGLDEGKKLGATTVKSLISKFPEEKKKLILWFKTYDALINKMEEKLVIIGVHPFSANPGDEADYDRYDPVDVEEDENYKDEQIKETLRRGYMLRYVEGEDEGQLIRPGQVVVVKNPAENE